MNAWKLPEEEHAALIALRRELHQEPELSWHEVETSARVVRELEALGLEVRRMADTGVVADIGDAGPLVALRADLDALPIQEQTDLAFSSRREGVMHACGHDAHTACLVAVARRLVADPPRGGRVRLIFQPAEEGAGGADVMIAQGVFQEPRPTAIYGMHVWSKLETGRIGVSAGPTMGSVDRFSVTLRGKGGHGAMPQDTVDPLIAGAHLVTTLQTLVSRRVDPLDSVVLSVGQFSAGTAFNVIPEEAELIGTIRTLKRETWEQIPTWLDELVHNTAAAFGCTAEVELQRMQRPLINHEAQAALVAEVAADFVPKENIAPLRMLAGEDFAAYLEEIPGCFFFVGARHKKHARAEDAAPHHNPFFLLDEDAFSLGVRLLEACARAEIQRQLSSD